MINFEVLEKFTKEEIIVIMDSLNGLLFNEDIPVKKQIIGNVEDNKYYNNADIKFNLEDSFQDLLTKLENLTEYEAVELAKYVEFSFYSHELPLNFGLYARDIKYLYNQ